MKIDDVVLYVIAGVAGLAALAYFAALLFGVVATRGVMLPALIAFLGVVALIYIVIRQRMSNREDDYYDTIEK